MRRCNTWIGSLALVGLAALVGCGGKAQTPGGVSPPSSPRPAPPTKPPRGGMAGGGDTVPPGVAPPGYMEGLLPAEPVNIDPPIPAMPYAEFILVSLCGSCHGPEAIANGNVQGGFDSINDISRVVQLGLIVPLHSAESPLLQVMQDGSMPPPGVEPRPTDLDIEIVAAYIDNPQFWDVPPVSMPALDGGAAASEDAGADGG